MGAMSDPHPEFPALPSFEGLARFLPGAVFRYRVSSAGVGRLDHMTSACLDIWELDPQALEHDMSALWAMVDPEDLGPMRDSVAACSAALVDWDHQWRITTPSGRRKWLHGMGRPMRDPDGSLVWHVFVVDQTHSRVALEAQRISEARFRRLIEAIPDVAIQGYDARLICRFWNAASARLYGFREEEAVGRSLLDLIIPEGMREDVIRATGHMLRTGEPIPSAELQLRHKNGQPVSVYSGHVLLRQGHGEPEFFCIDFDLTERRRAESARQLLESQLREAQKMEALGTLAGGIAHDFNNILAAILGNASMALEDLPDNSGTWTSVREIQKAARRARALVQQILTFARRQESRRGVVGLPPLAEEVFSLLRSTAPPGVSIDLRTAPQLPGLVGDANQIEQVMLNLGTNAVQAVAGQARARVTLELEAAVLSGALPDHAWRVLETNSPPGSAGVRIRVSDNGSGMSADVIQRIFEPFFTTKPRGQGTGLGLAVVHGILKEHNASLVVQSEEGIGTVFDIWFEAADGESERPEPEPAPVPAVRSTRGCRVLYVDDDPLLTDMVSRQLTKAGHSVTVLSDPLLALDRLAENPHGHDILITDHTMPQMSGLELVVRARLHAPQLPVILTSAVVSDELMREGARLALDRIIEKTGSPVPLCVAVQECLDLRSEGQGPQG